MKGRKKKEREGGKKVVTKEKKIMDYIKIFPFIV